MLATAAALLAAAVVLALLQFAATSSTSLPSVANVTLGSRQPPRRAAGRRSLTQQAAATATVYVSLTTIAHSAGLLRLTLSSLLDQTVQPEVIFVALHRSIDVPDLDAWQNSSRIQVSPPAPG